MIHCCRYKWIQERQLSSKDIDCVNSEDVETSNWPIDSLSFARASGNELYYLSVFARTLYLRDWNVKRRFIFAGESVRTSAKVPYFSRDHWQLTPRRGLLDFRFMLRSCKELLSKTYRVYCGNCSCFSLLFSMKVFMDFRVEPGHTTFSLYLTTSGVG